MQIDPGIPDWTPQPLRPLSTTAVGTARRDAARAHGGRAPQAPFSKEHAIILDIKHLAADPGASNPMSEREKLTPQITLLIPPKEAVVSNLAVADHCNVSLFWGIHRRKSSCFSSEGHFFHSSKPRAVCVVVWCLTQSFLVWQQLSDTWEPTVVKGCAVNFWRVSQPASDNANYHLISFPHKNIGWLGHLRFFRVATTILLFSFYFIVALIFFSFPYMRWRATEVMKKVKHQNSRNVKFEICKSSDLSVWCNFWQVELAWGFIGT